MPSFTDGNVRRQQVPHFPKSVSVGNIVGWYNQANAVSRRRRSRQLCRRNIFVSNFVTDCLDANPCLSIGSPSVDLLMDFRIYYEDISIGKTHLFFVVLVSNSNLINNVSDFSIAIYLFCVLCKLVYKNAIYTVSTKCSMLRIMFSLKIKREASFIVCLGPIKTVKIYIDCSITKIFRTRCHYTHFTNYIYSLRKKC